LVRIEADESYGGMYSFGGDDTDIANATAVNSSGTFYIGGYFMETADFDPGTGTENHTSNGGYDMFLSKYSLDTVPPIIISVNLDEGQIVSGDYLIETDVEDAKSGMQKVGFYVDGNLQAEDYTPTYDYNWNTPNLEGGQHEINIIAYDNQNNIAQVAYNVLVFKELPSTGSDFGVFVLDLLI
jgi:hypothetical protein